MLMASFRTSARTVDMLGRQQIAGVPSAISELFKNAHDAYADHASADFLRSERVLVLRDDGVGMTRRQFERNWLTLATASKATTARQEPPPPGMRARAVLGEKGIGRLAIAAIGSQTLVLTRRGAEVDGDVTAALIHWGAFELTDADLDEIAIPVVEVRSRRLPDVVTMADNILQTVLVLAGDDDTDLIKRMRADLSRWATLDLADLGDRVGSPDLVGESGTCFVVLPTSDDLAADLDDSATTQAPPLLRTLIGFANTMVPGHPAPSLTTAFYDHRADDDVVDLIEESEFFTPEEFTGADHRFTGRFDEYGQFEGSVTIFGGEAVDYPVAWTAARGVPTRCGPFDFDLAYVQGRASQSRLTPADYSRIGEKLERFGGLYIYRDGIRVLPYGDTRFDWLDIELRRTKSASDNFFSYRRMFGAVALTRDLNHGLREKAGREGFAANEAYRQFRAVLKQFFQQTAFEFFREGGARSAEYQEGRVEFERLEKARSARARLVGSRRRALADELEAFRQAVDADEPATRASVIFTELRGEVLEADQYDDDAAANRLVSAESRARQGLRDLDADLQVRRPRGVGLTPQLIRDVRDYEETRADLVASVLEPLERDIAAEVGTAGSGRQQAVRRRVRFDEAIREQSQRETRRVDRARTTLKDELQEVLAKGNAPRTEARVAVREAAEEMLSLAARIDVSRLADDDFVSERSRLEDIVGLVTDERLGKLTSVTDQLQEVAWPGLTEDVVTAADQVEDLEARLEAFVARAEQDIELTQIGMALDVVNHEFTTSIRSIRANLRRLKSWSDENEDLEGVYRGLRTSFDHLDGYLKLFTPLHRRLYRSAIDIKGGSILNYLKDVFDTHLQASEATLDATPAFVDAVLSAYPSTVYPAFVNLVDNALHWLEEYRGPRSIVLDADGADFTVTDSGPGIPARDADRIFELGFTRKPGGTGYGLSISREALRAEGFTLTLDPPGASRGARFRIGRDVQGDQ